MAKNFILVCLILFTACSNYEPKIESTNILIPQKPVFLTKAEVFDELKQLSSMKYMDAPLTVDDKERMGKLIDPDVFFHRDLKTEKKMTKLTFKGEGEVDLRNRDTAVKSQDNGKCTAFAGVAALENTMNRNKIIPGLNLSEWDAWSHYQQYSCEAFIRAASRYNICDEKYYQQYGSKKSECEKTAYVKLSENTYLGESLSGVVAALDRGNVVYVGMSTPMDIVRCKKVISENTTVSNGGHAMVVTGYYKKDGKVIFIIRNSWGSDCGDYGYHYMPASVCNKRSMYCVFWEIKGVSVAGTPSPVEPTCTKWEKIWYQPWKYKCVKWS